MIYQIIKMIINDLVQNDFICNVIILIAMAHLHFHLLYTINHNIFQHEKQKRM